MKYTIWKLQTESHNYVGNLSKDKLLMRVSQEKKLIKLGEEQIFNKINWRTKL